MQLNLLASFTQDSQLSGLEAIDLENHQNGSQDKDFSSILNSVDDSLKQSYQDDTVFSQDEDVLNSSDLDGDLGIEWSKFLDLELNEAYDEICIEKKSLPIDDVQLLTYGSYDLDIHFTKTEELKCEVNDDEGLIFDVSYFETMISSSDQEDIEDLELLDHFGLPIQEISFDIEKRQIPHQEDLIDAEEVKFEIDDTSRITSLYQQMSTDFTVVKPDPQIDEIEVSEAAQNLDIDAYDISMLEDISDLDIEPNYHQKVSQINGDRVAYDKEHTKVELDSLTNVDRTQQYNFNITQSKNSASSIKANEVSLEKDRGHLFQDIHLEPSQINNSDFDDYSFIKTSKILSSLSEEANVEKQISELPIAQMDSSENNTSDFDKKIIDNDIDDFIVKKSESLSSEKVVINSNNSLDKPSILQVQPNKNLQPQNIQNEKALIHQDKFQESIPDMVKFTLSQNRKKAEIILNPKELGEVSIDVQSQENGNYKVTIVTQSASAAELFLKNQHLLEKSFIEQGAQNSQLSFEFKQQEHSQQSQDNYNSEFSMAGKESREQEETRQTLPREVDDRILSIRI